MERGSGDDAAANATAMDKDFHFGAWSFHCFQVDHQIMNIFVRNTIQQFVVGRPAGLTSPPSAQSVRVKVVELARGITQAVRRSRQEIQVRPCYRLATRGGVTVSITGAVAGPPRPPRPPRPRPVGNSMACCRSTGSAKRPPMPARLRGAEPVRAWQLAHFAVAFKVGLAGSYASPVMTLM